MYFVVSRGDAPERIYFDLSMAQGHFGEDIYMCYIDVFNSLGVKVGCYCDSNNEWVLTEICP